MQVTVWDLAKAVGVAIIQLNAATLAISIVLGPVFELYDIVRDWREARNGRR